MTASIAEKRKKCILGDLPNDFLRMEASHVSSDAQTAQMLQAQQWGAAASPTQMSSVPQLEISVVQAKLAKNYGIARMDPYCRLRVGHQVYETPTCLSGSKNPKWNRKFVCNLPRGVESIYLEIYDEKTFSVDDRIAWSHITVPSAVMNGDTVDDWYPLSGKLGEEKEGMINIVISFREMKMPVHNPLYGGYPHVVTMPYNPMMYPGNPAVQPVRQQHSVSQPVEISEDDVKDMSEMFPSVDKEVVRSVLEEKNGNKEATINALLSMSTES